MRSSGAWRFQTPRRGLLLWAGVVSGTAGAEWGSQATFDAWFSPTNRTVVRNAGFDWLRMHINFGAITGQSAGTKTTRINAFVANVARLEASGFRVIFGIDITQVGGGVYDGVSGTAWTELCDCAAEMAAGIFALRKPATIAWEPVNEPPGVITNYIDHTLVLNARIRTVDENVSIFTGGASWQGYTAAQALDGTLFTDARMGLAYHFYPEPYTQQGLGGVDWHQSFQRIEFPPVGANKTQQLADLETRMTALGVAAGNKAELRAEVSLHYDTPQDAAWVTAQHVATVAHGVSLGLPLNRIICTEWNVTGDGKVTNGIGAAAARVAGLAATRAAIEAQGIGWGLNQLYGYSGTDAIYGQGIVDNSTFTFDAGLVGALIVAAPYYDADAVAYFVYAGALSDARKLLISNLVAGIKSDLGIATLAARFDGFWLLANETATAARKNIAKNDHHCTAVNSPTFTADQGYAGNGSTSYLGTDYIPSTDGVALSLNSTHFSLYNRTNRTTSNAVGNAGKSSGTDRLVMYCSYGNTTYIGLNCPDINFGAATTSQGFWIVNRSASNAVQCDRNGSSVGTATNASTGLPAIELYIGGTNATGSLANATTDQHAFMSVGGSLSSPERAALNTRVETYMDAIGAGVI